MSVITLKLDGLHCEHCVRSVKNALSTLPTVRRIELDLKTQLVEVESDEEAEILINTIIDIGFEAQTAKS